MRPLRMILRAGFRHRWRAWLALTLLLGVMGGVVLEAAAGARRTDTAYPRLLAASNAAQVEVLPTGNGSPYGAYPGFFRAVGSLPQVASMSTSSLFNMVLPVRRGQPPAPVEALASPDGRQGITVDRVRVLAGHMFSPRSTGSAMIDRRLAQREHLRPGGTLRLLAVPGNGPRQTPDLARAVPVTFRVTAVVRFDTQIVPGITTAATPTVLLSPSFAAPRAERRYGYGTVANVRLRPGASMTGFLREARKLAARFPGTGPLEVITLGDQAAATERAIRPQAFALGAFAALAGLISLAVIAQLLSRQVVLDAGEFPVLRALGMSRSRLAVLSMARMGGVTVSAGWLAVGIAVAASPVTPIGPARLAEPSPGVEVNLAILGTGLAVIALLPLALAAPVAWRAAIREAGTPGSIQPAASAWASGLGSVLSRAGSVTGGLGARLAFERGHGRTAVPVRSAMAGTAVAVAAVLAALVFGTSLIRLVSTPTRYGQDWAQQLDLKFGGVTAPLLNRLMAGQPGVSGYALGNYGQVSAGGTAIPAIGIDPRGGRGYLTMLQGRPPSAPGEIALGTQTLQALHLRVGQTVHATINGIGRRLRIVGRAVFAAFSRGTFTTTGLGTGAAVVAQLLSTPNLASRCFRPATCYNFILVRYRPGYDPQAAASSLMAAVNRLGCPPGSCTVTADQRPAGIRHYASVRDTPLVLGGLLALLAVATLAHVLITGVRRRGRDLAVFKALGLTRGQVVAVVAWQASALAAVALAVGVPLGIVAGRWAWALFAGSAGVAGDTDIPAPLVLAAILGTLVLANLIAAAPGRAAARLRPAAALRGG